MEIDYVAFPQRADRSRYIANRFGNFLQGSVLDVGCDQAVLRSLLGANTGYFGIDVGGKPDLTVNLDENPVLPFANDEFNCTVCSDVLEHLDKLHLVFNELVRVSKRHLVISLPNNWANARRPIERGKGSIAHYGLPAAPPPDRHRWFFGFTEARLFLEAQAKAHGLSILQFVANDKPRSSLVRLARRARFDQDRYLNRYAHTLWAVFAKPSA